MILTHNYFYFKKAVPVETCKKILEAGRKKIIEQATTIKGVDKTKRDCKISWLDEEWI